VKAAAPQAPGSTQQTAKTRAKGRGAPAKTAGAVAFAGALASALAARGKTATASSPVRGAAGRPAAVNSRTEAGRGKTPSRTAARAEARGRVVAEPGVERTAAEAFRAAAGQPAAAATAPAAAAAAARRGEPRIQVVDLRKKAAAAEAPTTGRAATKAPAETGDAPAVAERPFAERLAAARTDVKAAAAERPAPLARIRAMTGSDLVRTVGLVVRDGGGEIRLTLKPESLGSVRIRLSIEDGKVEGRIVVDTPEARHAFEAGIDSLTRALQADGFQTGSMQVSVSGGNANDSRQAAGLLGDTIRSARARASDEALQAAVPLAGWVGGDGLVDVFA